MSGDLQLRDHVQLEANTSRSLAPTSGRPLPLIHDDKDLVPLLRRATNEELAPLVEYILKKGSLSSELELTTKYRQNQSNHRAYADEIAAEIQKFGANTLASRIFRGGRGVRYREIACDVAKRLGLKIRWGQSIASIERAITEKVFTDAYENTSENERQELLASLGIQAPRGLHGAAGVAAVQAAIHAGGFTPYMMSVIVANGMSHAVVGHGLAYGANAALTKWMAIFAGPIGWAFTGLITAAALGGPAYRVTLPCVVQVGFVRQQVRKRRRKKLLLVLAVLLPLAMARAICSDLADADETVGWFSPIGMAQLNRDVLSFSVTPV